MDLVSNEGKPSVLYHYTDQPGLLGILQYKKLWMTHHAFLNDANEIRYSKPLMKQVVAEMEDRIPDDSFQDWMDGFDVREERQKDQTYIVCFSSHGDQLSQWRAYANDGAGFTIGISNSILEHLAGEQGWCFGPERVVYDRQLQIELMRNAINQGFAGHAGELIEFWDSLLEAHAMNFKDAAFSEESEWRMNSIFINTGKHTDAPPTPSPMYRSTKYGLAPYVELSIPANAIVEIVVGPKSPMRNKHWVLRQILEANGITNPVKLTNSSAAYR